MDRPLQITRLSKPEFYGSMFEIMKRQDPVAPQIPLTILSKRVAERVITDDSAGVPDCIECGACCLYGLIPIERREPEPLLDYVEITAEDTDVVIERAFRRNEDGRCQNLLGVVAEEVGCTVYADRPRTCRDFEAGSDRCFGYRRMFGIDPLLSETEVETALKKLDSITRPTKITAVDIKVESKTFTFDQETGDAVAEEVVLKIIAHMSDGDEKEIHKFDPAKESWYEHELEGIGLEAAMEKIRSSGQE